MTYFHTSINVYLHYLALEMYNHPAFTPWRNTSDRVILIAGLKLEELDLPFLFKALFFKEMDKSMRAKKIKKQPWRYI